MPVFSVSDPAIVALNVAYWLVSTALAGWWAARLPDEALAHDTWLGRERAWEDRGAWYDRCLRIRRWKDRLPEAGTFFGGRSKRSLGGRRDADLKRFLMEARRAERAHWWNLVGLPLTVLWNPALGVALMAAFGIVFNAPFIAIQRYNRARIRRILERRAGRAAGPTSSAAPGPAVEPAAPGDQDAASAFAPPAGSVGPFTTASATAATPPTAAPTTPTAPPATAVTTGITRRRIGGTATTTAPATMTGTGFMSELPAR